VHPLLATESTNNQNGLKVSLLARLTWVHVRYMLSPDVVSVIF